MARSACMFQGWLAAGTEATGGGGGLVFILLTTQADYHSTYVYFARSVLRSCAAANHQPMRRPRHESCRNSVTAEAGVSDRPPSSRHGGRGGSERCEAAIFSMAPQVTRPEMLCGLGWLTARGGA